jgi:anti-sigma regulatory factor (Ser/Thr protein kinase)
MSNDAVQVGDGSQVAEARRRASTAAAQLGFDPTLAGQVALVVTELATNLLKHGRGGEVLLMRGDRRLDVLALDAGPGMRDVAACMADGYSTAGTLGHGLGAVRRQASDVRVASWGGLGTAVLARFGEPALDDDTLGAVVVAKPGEEACGDAWCRHEDDEALTLMVVDGLGHGIEAADAAHAAVARFQRAGELDPRALLEALHEALRPTRGAAVAVARVHRRSATVSFAGLGNIAAAIVGTDGTVRRLVSHNGIAGHNARKIQAFDYPCREGLLVMHSDGVSTHWSLDRYPGLLRANPLLVAGILYHHHGRRRDDATVVAARLVP